MPRWTRTRAKKLTRRKNGTFKVWKGGKKKSELKKKRNSFQGIAIHIGYQFKKQNGRKAKKLSKPPEKGLTATHTRV